MSSAGRWGQQVHCPAPGCDYTGRRNNLGTHLQTQQHSWPKAKAWAAAKAAKAVSPQPAQLPAVVELPAVQEPIQPGLDWSHIDPTDIALGVVESQARAVPVELLAEVVAYVDLTRALVMRLRSHQ